MGLNRAFVRQGLKIMRTRQRIGLNALMDVARLDRPVEPYHLGFLLGPRINAGGRIGNAALGAQLLMSKDEAECTRIATELERLNRERQATELVMVEEAMAQAELQMGPAPMSILVTHGKDWHPGVVGLVASRLKERFGKPAFAFGMASLESTHGTGSGRSIAGVDLGRAVRAAVETGLLVKGGGHAMAAGATIDIARIPDFQAYLHEALSMMVGEASEGDSLLIDGLLSASGATSAFLADIERASPFGEGNPEPVFALADHRLKSCQPMGAGNHLTLSLAANDDKTIRGVAFRAADQPLGRFLMARVGQRIHVAGTLTLDRYGGRERVDLRVLDAAQAEAVL